MSKEKKDELIWTVTYRKDSGVKIEAGPELEKYETDTKLAVIAQQMVTIGTRLIGSSVTDDGWDDDEWGDDE